LIFPTGNTDIEEKIDVKPAHKITAERILHLGKGTNRKVSQQDPLSLSNSDGDMQLATQFRTKRSGSLDYVDYKQYNSYAPPASPAYSYYSQVSASAPTYALHPSPANEYNYPAPLQTAYHQQPQNEYFHLPQTQHYVQQNVYNHLDPNAYYTNPNQNLDYYYNALLTNPYYNIPQWNTYSQPQLGYVQPPQYDYYQTQYLQSQQNAYQTQQMYYYQPMQYNAMWNANPYVPAQSQQPVSNVIVPIANQNEVSPSCGNQLQTVDERETGAEIGALTGAEDDVLEGNNHNKVLNYHRMIDALYDENNLAKELGASEEYA
jgi:hypothetical protein